MRRLSSLVGLGRRAVPAWGCRPRRWAGAMVRNALSDMKAVAAMPGLEELTEPTPNRMAWTRKTRHIVSAQPTGWSLRAQPM